MVRNNQPTAQILLNAKALAALLLTSTALMPVSVFAQTVNAGTVSASGAQERRITDYKLDP